MRAICLNAARLSGVPALAASASTEGLLLDDPLHQSQHRLHGRHVPLEQHRAASFGGTLLLKQLKHWRGHTDTRLKRLAVIFGLGRPTKGDDVMDASIFVTPLRDAWRRCRPALAAAALFSGLLNVLTLALPLHSMQVMDRVLASRQRGHAGVSHAGGARRHPARCCLGGRARTSSGACRRMVRGSAFRTGMQTGRSDALAGLGNAPLELADRTVQSSRLPLESTPSRFSLQAATKQKAHIGQFLTDQVPLNFEACDLSAGAADCRSDRVVGPAGALAAGAAVSAALVLRDLVGAGRSVKLLEVGTLVLFAALTLYTVLSGTDWSGHRCAAVRRCRIAAGGGARVHGRCGRPFTLQYAREQVAPELWNQPSSSGRTT